MKTSEYCCRSIGGTINMYIAKNIKMYFHNCHGSSSYEKPLQCCYAVQHPIMVTLHKDIYMLLRKRTVHQWKRPTKHHVHQLNT